MPQESDPKPPAEPVDTLSRGVMQNVQAEPIPARIVELAKTLDKVLAEKRQKPPT